MMKLFPAAIAALAVLLLSNCSANAWPPDEEFSNFLANAIATRLKANQNIYEAGVRDGMAVGSMNIPIPGHENGYIGERTRIEIEHAKSLGKVINYHTPRA